MNFCYNYFFLCKESFDLHRVSEWPSDAVGRRLAFVVVSPARDVAVASKCQRVIVTSGNRDEVAVHAVGRRLVPIVVSPARDAAVASKRQRVLATRSNRDEVAVHAVGRCLAEVVGAPARDAAVASNRERVLINCGDRDEIAVNPLPQGGSGNLPTQALHTGRCCITLSKVVKQHARTRRVPARNTLARNTLGRNTSSGIHPVCN